MRVEGADSKGEATCLREICEICVRVKYLRDENRAISEIALTKKSTDETDETERDKLLSVEC